MIAEQTEKDIDETRSLYIPVAVRTQILFFCTYDLVSAIWSPRRAGNYNYANFRWPCEIVYFKTRALYISESVTEFIYPSSTLYGVAATVADEGKLYSGTSI